MLTTALIERKRDGGALRPEEWSSLIEAYVAGRVPDYQMAALLMAIVFRGLLPDEVVALTDAMVRSGRTLAFGADAPARVDKHSTGGVGDKVSLVLAPLVSSCGVAVPMMSGRGLGHTGGTLDKLEAIPGFRTRLGLDDARRQVERLGVAMFGQTSEVAPADGLLYALRDATSTVESIPLIAASIMSKKLAEGLNGLVLDVKRGSGAFLRRMEDQLDLAKTMIALGEAHGCRTVALLTAMDRPLGWACGNALETEEAFATLRGEGPEDLIEVTLALGAEMLVIAEAAPDREAARGALVEALTSGRGAAAGRAMIAAQGGNPAVLDDPAGLPQATRCEPYAAPTSGTVLRVEPRTIGKAIVEMGGGRVTKDDEIDATVGFVITVKPGDRVREGQPLASIYANDDATVALGREALEEAVRVGDGQAQPLPLVSHRVTSGGVQKLA